MNPTFWICQWHCLFNFEINCFCVNRSSWTLLPFTIASMNDFLHDSCRDASLGKCKHPFCHTFPINNAMKAQALLPHHPWMFDSGKAHFKTPWIYKDVRPFMNPVDCDPGDIWFEDYGIVNIAGETDEEMLLVRFSQFSEEAFNSSLASCSTESAEILFSWGTFPFKWQINVYYPSPTHDIQLCMTQLCMALPYTLVICGWTEGVLFLHANGLFVNCYNVIRT